MSAGHHSDHHSDLTEPFDDDQNFIALLQYQDACDILNVTHSGRSNSIPPETIQNAYDSAKKQVLIALKQLKARENQANGRDMLIVSQQNYLELKLQALDQAYEELMPIEQINLGREYHCECSHADEHDRCSMLGVKYPGMEASLPERTKGMDHVGNEDGPGTESYADTSAAIRSVRMQNRDCDTHGKTYQEHQRVPFGDELDTIDIYFRPNPNTNSKSSNGQRTKEPDDPSDVTWDGSSIFSMMGKSNIEDVSMDGLSDVLGPIHSSSPGRSGRVTPTKSQGEVKALVTANQNDGQLNRHSNCRPPLGIDIKQRKQGRGFSKPHISPKSVTDFPGGIQNDKVVVRSSHMVKRSHRYPSRLSHEATEAARMGILRALSEDNSECLPLDDEEYHGHSNVSNEMQDLSKGAKFMRRHPVTSESGLGSKMRLFAGKSDFMAKENNSLMASVLNDKPSEASSIGVSLPSNEVHSSVTTSGNRVDSSTSLHFSTTSMNRQQRKGKLATAPAAQLKNKYDGLLQPGEYSYAAILQTGIELADELCTALNSCWGGDEGISKTLARASSSASASWDVAKVKDDESTIFTRSTYTTDESKTLNTVKSFSRRGDSLSHGREKRSSSSDPPTRMLV